MAGPVSEAGWWWRFGKSLSPTWESREFDRVEWRKQTESVTAFSGPEAEVLVQLATRVGAIVDRYLLVPFIYYMAHRGTDDHFKNGRIIREEELMKPDRFKRFLRQQKIEMGPQMDLEWTIDQLPENTVAAS